MENLDSNYRYSQQSPWEGHNYLWEPIKRLVSDLKGPSQSIFEIGCGNGEIANCLKEEGHTVTAIDPSSSGIAAAKQSYSNIHFALGSTVDDLVSQYGTFPVVLSLEVVEHCFSPKQFSERVFDLVEPGGVALISTPYHGYLKNLALAVTNSFDQHWSPTWEGGHIKFWSPKTLTILLENAGFADVDFVKVGRIPPLAKSMIAIAKKH